MNIVPFQAAILASVAEAMTDQNTLTPSLPSSKDWLLTGHAPYILDSPEWEIIGHLSAVDATIGQRLLGTGERVYYGFLARSNADPLQHILVFRGTEPMRLVEWLEDGFAALIAHPTFGRVHAGIWKLYGTVMCGAGTLIDAVKALPRDAILTVIGHSLGAAMSTFAATDLAAAFPDRIRAYLFASPKPGDQQFAGYSNRVIGPSNYTHFAYSRDVVPFLPLTLPGLDFARQLSTSWITPATASAKIKHGISCAHHATSYAAMLGARLQTDCIEGG